MVEFAELALPAGPRTVAAYVAVLETARQEGFLITRTKIAKLLYLADLEAVQEGSPPISGVQWLWHNYGPYHNDLLALEGALVTAGVVEREREIYYGGWELRLARDYVPQFLMPADDRELLDTVVTRLGRLAANTLKDMSYQTPPMVEAQRRGRGVVLNLALARRLPDLSGTAAKMAEVLRSLPPQDNDSGAVEDLAQEIRELSPALERANRILLADD